MSAEQLVEELWDAPPLQAVPGVHSHASRLRALLSEASGADLLSPGAGGYRLDAQVDADAFELLFAQGRSELLDGRAAACVDILTQALDMWRGPAYGSLRDTAFARAEAARLEEVRRTAENDLLSALLSLGRWDDALTAAAPMLAREPLRERLWATRMVALARSGRQAEALDAYRSLHRLLSEELGVEPEQALQQLHAAVLAGEAPDLPALGTAVGSPAPAVAAGPEVRWATSGDAHIAYQVVGDGPIDLLLVPSYLSHLELQWQWPSYAALLSALASRARLIVMDKRGMGLSDRVHTADLDLRGDDVRAVLDAASSETAVVLASSEGASGAVPFAAAAPDRVAHLVLFGCMPRLRGAGWDVGPTPEQYLERMERLYDEWGTGRSLTVFAPTAAEDPAAVAWYSRMERDAVTPGGLLQLVRTSARLDYTSYLERLRVPTLLLHRRDEAVPVDASRRVSQIVPHAELIELDGEDHLIWFGDTRPVVQAVAGVLAHCRP